ncbi:Hypothetical predicted protein [Paramuricea clavata]|uniref:Uncharacterized protein n=1 Tax=Paramuricea clavata TaxID=317549 RepID=A0A7D9EVW4_PARCT|nr:Hypothetical predicted protein [Paramuricea clavata]
MALIFDFKNANEKSWFRNNLGKLLQKRLEIRLAGEKVYDNGGESLLEIYKDLWMDEKQRADKIQDGIATEAVRKKISKDDEANADADATTLFGIFGTKQRMKITKILKDHGFYAPYHMANDLEFVITLPPASEIMNAQGGETVDGYSVDGIGKFGTGIRIHREFKPRTKIRKFVRSRTRVIFRTRDVDEKDRME